MAKSISTILFDLDGTIINTEPSSFAALKFELERLQVTLDQSDHRHLLGRTRHEGIAYLIKKYQLTIPHHRLLTNICETYRGLLEKNLPLIPGSAQAILNLEPHYQLGLVSGSARAEIEWALNQLNIRHCFSAIFGAEDYEKGKPSPDPYLKAIDHFRVKADEVIVFEDSLVGIQSGMAAGATVVAIQHAAKHFPHYEEIGQLAHHTIADFNQIDLQWIGNLTPTDK